jgi:CRP/FNR family transcriptional regulator, anaerobic regulatory protein
MQLRIAVESSTSCEGCALRSSSICGLLARGNTTRLERLRSNQFKLRAKRLLLQEGDTPQEVYRLRSGWGARFKLLANGLRQILSFDLPGEFMSPELLQEAPSRFSKVALTDIAVCAFPSAIVRAEIAQDRAEAEIIAEYWTPRVAELEQRVMMLGRMHASGRIAALLLDFLDRLTARGECEGSAFEFPLRHEDIADALGITGEHVSRTLSGLRESRLLRMEQGRVVILDRQSLRRLAS